MENFTTHLNTPLYAVMGAWVGAGVVKENGIGTILNSFKSLQKFQGQFHIKSEAFIPCGGVARKGASVTQPRNTSSRKALSPVAPCNTPNLLHRAHPLCAEIVAENRRGGE